MIWWGNHLLRWITIDLYPIGQMESVCQAIRSGSRSKGKCLQSKIAESLQIFKADGGMVFYRDKKKLRVLKSRLGVKRQKSIEIKEKLRVP